MFVGHRLRRDSSLNPHHLADTVLGASGKFVLAAALLAQAYTLYVLQDFDVVEPLSQEALRLGKELQTNWMKGDAFNQLGILAWQQGDYVHAHRQLLTSYLL